MAIKSGNVILRWVRGPDKSVNPGDPFEIQVKVSNGAWPGFLSPTDPDACNNPNTPCQRGTAFNEGYCVEAVLEPPQALGSTRTERDCIGTTELGSYDVIYKFQFTAPDSEGEYEFSAFARTTASGAQTESMSTRVQVNKDPVLTPPEEDDDGWLGGGNGGDDNNNNNNDKDLLQLALENPVGAVVVSAAGGMALREVFGGD
jgi:hypothetical protein